MNSRFVAAVEEIQRALRQDEKSLPGEQLRAYARLIGNKLVAALHEAEQNSAATTQAGENDPCLVKLSCMLQALEFPPAAIAMSGPQLAVVCKEIVAGYKANAPSQPVAWQCAEHGYDDWHEIPKESFGINPQRYKYRELCAYTPVGDGDTECAECGESFTAHPAVAPVVPDGVAENLKLLDSGRCENFTAGDCATHDRDKHSPWSAERWCATCLARESIDLLCQTLHPRSQR